MLRQIEQAEQLQTIALAVKDSAQVAGPKHEPTRRSPVGGQMKGPFLPRRGGLSCFRRDGLGSPQGDRCAEKIQAQSYRKTVAPQHSMAPEKQTATDPDRP